METAERNVAPAVSVPPPRPEAAWPDDTPGGADDAQVPAEIVDDRVHAAREPSELVAALLAGDPSFEFFHAVRLLESHFPGALDPVGSFAPDAARIAFRPHVGLAFPGSDLRTVEPNADGGEGATLVLNFLGLYGVDSPLPAYFGTAALADDASELRDFLDIFSNRVYALFYESWKKYRASLHPAAHDRGAEAERLLCLTGWATPGSATAARAAALLPFAGILRTRVRSGEGLLRLIADVLPGVEVTLEENVPRWVEVTERPTVGRRRAGHAVLGVNAILGRRLLDTSGRFRLVVGPVGWRLFQDLQPGEPAALSLAETVRSYAPDYLEYEVELRIHTSELPITRLSSPGNHLGLTTWVGKPRQEMISQVIRYA